jgi:hypothetical protein
MQPVEQIDKCDLDFAMGRLCFRFPLFPRLSLRSRLAGLSSRQRNKDAANLEPEHTLWAYWII